MNKQLKSIADTLQPDNSIEVAQNMRASAARDAAMTMGMKVGQTLTNWQTTEDMDIEAMDIETLRKLARFQRDWMREIRESIEADGERHGIARGLFMVTF